MESIFVSRLTSCMEPSFSFPTNLMESIPPLPSFLSLAQALSSAVLLGPLGIQEIKCKVKFESGRHTHRSPTHADTVTHDCIVCSCIYKISDSSKATVPLHNYCCSSLVFRSCIAHGQINMQGYNLQKL